jgi:hypothetical protein
MFRGLIPPTPPLVIDKTRTVVLGGEQVTSQRLSVEMQEQSLADLQWMLRFIAQRDTVEQIKLGNPPSITTIDGKASEELSTAQKRVEVLFGSRLATQAMRMVETTLRLNIQKATNAHTGKLANVTANWRWRLVTPGKGSRVVTSASTLPAFQRGSLLVLEPYGVPYATRVNSRVLGGGGLRSRRTPRIAKGTFGPPKPKQPVGFLRATVEALRSRAEFKSFSVIVEFTKQFAVPGELSRKQGSGVIVIRARRVRG